MSYVQPDKIYNVPIEDGFLHLSPAYDVLHHFQPIAAWILKYWNTESGGLSDVIMCEDSARFLIKACGIQVLERDSITEFEYERVLTWRTELLTDDVLDGTD